MNLDGIELIWKGHSSFMINYERVIYIDPFKLTGDLKKADIILITHSHYDHCSIEDLSKITKDGTIVIMPADCQSKLTKINNKIKFHILEPGQEFINKEIKIKAVPAYNIHKQFHEKNEYWNGYLIFLNDKIIYHAGDTDLIPEMSYFLDYGKIEVALLPVSGTFTMTPDEAARAAFLIMPRIAIPIHWGTVAGTIEDAERFVELCKDQGIKAEILEKQ